MKVIKTKLLQKAEGKKRGKYQITLEVSDYDMDMLEDLATTYAPYNYADVFIGKDGTMKKATVGIDILDFNDKYHIWTMMIWKCFHKLWKRYY